MIEQTAKIVGFNYQTGSPVFGDVAYSNLGIQKATGIEALYNKDLPLGISMQIGATYISQFGNEPPGTFLQPAALALGLVYRSPDLSPFQINAAFNYQNAHGWRIDPVIGFNVGYPYGAGYYTAVYCNGIPVVVPASSLSVIYSQTPGYIDPLDPGSCTKPNIAATRGIHEPGLAGGLLTTPRVDANLTIEYRPPVAKACWRNRSLACRSSICSISSTTCRSTTAVTARRSQRDCRAATRPAPIPPRRTRRPTSPRTRPAPYLDLSESAADLVPPLLPGDDMISRTRIVLLPLR